MSSSDSRYSKGSRRASTSKKHSSTSNRTSANKTEAPTSTTYYPATNPVALKGVPLYSSLSVSNQYSVLTKGVHLTEFSKETWSTQINVSQNNVGKSPTSITAQQYSSKEFSASLVTSKSSVKTAAFQINPEGAANNVVFASTVGRSNTIYSVQGPAPEGITTTLRTKSTPQPQPVTVTKAVTDNVVSNAILKSSLSANKAAHAQKSVAQKTLVPSAKHVSITAVPKSSKFSSRTTSAGANSNSVKSVPVVSTQTSKTTVQNGGGVSKLRARTTVRKVGHKEKGVGKIPQIGPTTSTIKNSKNIQERAVPAASRLKSRVSVQKICQSKKQTSAKPHSKSKSKIVISKDPVIKRRKSTHPKFNLAPTYKLTGNESLILEKNNSLVINRNLLARKSVKLIIRKTSLPKVTLKKVHCGPIKKESETDKPFVLPKPIIPPFRYDFHKNLIKRKYEVESESRIESIDDCTEEIEELKCNDEAYRYARAENRLLRCRAFFRTGENSQVISKPPPRQNPPQSGMFDVQVVSENIVNILRKDIIGNRSLPEVSTTNSFMTFHSSINPCGSSSTATTNVTQTTTTPIVSSFVKERTTTAKDVATPAHSSTLPNSKDEKSYKQQEQSTETESTSSSKFKESSKSKSKSKSKESSSKNKSKESSKRKTKESSSSHKNQSDKTSTNDKSETTAANGSVKVSDASKVNCQPTATLPSEVTPSSSNVATSSSSNETAASSSAAKTPAAEADDSIYDFSEDIKYIMHAFGDCDDPNPDSVKMMEVIVREELNGFVYLCEIAALITKAKTLHFREAVFALRREKQRLGRLFRYFKVKEKHRPAKQPTNPGSKEPVVTYELELRKIAEEIDETGEYARLFECGPETTLENCELRADRIVQRLTMPKFLMFSKARSVSYARKMPRLVEWVVDNIHAKIPLSLAFVDILGFLTYEIVAELMNMAILVRTERVAITPTERIVDGRGLNPDTCMSDPTFFKRRCFGLQSVSEILVQAGELQAMRLKRAKTSTHSFRGEYHRQVLPIDVREGYLRFANEHLLEPSLSYKCQAKELACSRSSRWLRKAREVSSTNTSPPIT